MVTWRLSGGGGLSRFSNDRGAVVVPEYFTGPIWYQIIIYEAGPTSYLERFGPGFGGIKTYFWSPQTAVFTLEMFS